MGSEHNIDRSRFSVRDQKNELRAKFKEKRKALDLNLKELYDKEISQRILSLAGLRFADTVLSYSPLGGEVDISKVNEAIIKSGKRLALPRCIKNTPIMEFRIVDSLDKLKKGSFSIYEPDDACPIWIHADCENAICLVPGMSFDKNGNRLGYGKGYYDRYLTGKQITKIGVVYSEFISERLPCGRYDLAMDLIVTERKILRPH